MIFGVFPDLGAWTSAIEQFVYICGVLVIGAGVARVLSLTVLFSVRGWCFVRVFFRSKKPVRK